MNASPRLFTLLKSFEGCRLVAYQDQASVWTIGWGSIMYRDGTRVQQGDEITQAKADDLLSWQVNLKAAAVNGLGINLNQNQFDALVDFAYNEGVGALDRSSLIKAIRMNANDPHIRDDFDMWIMAGGKKNDGLLKRRNAEADLYFTPIQ